MTRLFSKEAFERALISLNEHGRCAPVVYAEIDSTSTELKRLLDGGAKASTIVVAHRQTHGRGRLGRIWSSPPAGNLNFSLAIETVGPVERTVPLVPLAAGIAAHEAISNEGAAPLLKWPNDVLVSGKKVCGILCEAHTLKKDRAVIVVGLGVNIVDAPFPPELCDSAASLNAILKRQVDMSVLAAGFHTALNSWCRVVNEGNVSRIVDAWRRRAEPFGRRVKVGDVEGTTVKLADDGRLVIVNDHGAEHLIAGGIVEYVT